jgi:hypothetical protein
MALKVEAGSLTSPGSTGNQTVTLADAGFGTVKAVMLWGSYATSDENASRDGIFCIGFGSYRGATPQQWFASHWADDAAGTSACAAGHTSASILRGYSNGTPTLDFDAALVSLGDASFVVNWTDLPGTPSILFNYVALGGADITDALVDKMDVTTGTGTQDETVVASFGKPDLLFQTMAVANTTEGDSASLGGNITLGVGKSDSQQGCSAFVNEHGAASMQLASFQEADFLGFLSNDTTLALNAVLTAVASWPTDGFQINKLSNSLGASARMGYLALKGSFTAVVGAGTAPTDVAPVTQDLAVGATPRGAVFFHNVLPTTAGLDNTHADLGTFAIGATDGTHSRWEGVGDDDAAASSATHINRSSGMAVKMFTPSAAGTLTSEASGSINGTDVRLTWADTDTVAREYRYVLLGDESGVAASKPKSLGMMGCG